ncbi:hypothetical protein [Taibaiella koreensis]|uniref:hypothetical protein n=1 Tax=Taibaiella koreensis TaxID=1268548 RepID=UPI000E59A1D5|nr:hypothetical protein [Taibaiella koreensis]
MKKLQSIKAFKGAHLADDQLINVTVGGKPITIGLSMMTDDYSLGNPTGPYPLDGTCDCVDLRDGDIWGGLGSGQVQCP